MIAKPDPCELLGDRGKRFVRDLLSGDANVCRMFADGGGMSASGVLQSFRGKYSDLSWVSSFQFPVFLEMVHELLGVPLHEIYDYLISAVTSEILRRTTPLSGESSSVGSKTLQEVLERLLPYSRLPSLEGLFFQLLETYLHLSSRSHENIVTVRRFLGRVWREKELVRHCPDDVRLVVWEVFPAICFEELRAPGGIFSRFLDVGVENDQRRVRIVHELAELVGVKKKIGVAKIESLIERRLRLEMSKRDSSGMAERTRVLVGLIHDAVTSEFRRTKCLDYGAFFWYFVSIHRLAPFRLLRVLFDAFGTNPDPSHPDPLLELQMHQVESLPWLYPRLKSLMWELRAVPDGSMFWFHLGLMSSGILLQRIISFVVNGILFKIPIEKILDEEMEDQEPEDAVVSAEQTPGPSRKKPKKSTPGDQRELLFELIGGRDASGIAVRRSRWVDADLIWMVGSLLRLILLGEQVSQLTDPPSLPSPPACFWSKLLDFRRSIIASELDEVAVPTHLLDSSCENLVWRHLYLGVTVSFLHQSTLSDKFVLWWNGFLKHFPRDICSLDIAFLQDITSRIQVIARSNPEIVSSILDRILDPFLRAMLQVALDDVPHLKAFVLKVVRLVFGLSGPPRVEKVLSTLPAEFQKSDLVTQIRSEVL